MHGVKAVGNRWSVPIFAMQFAAFLLESLYSKRMGQPSIHAQMASAVGRTSCAGPSSYLGIKEPIRTWDSAHSHPM